MNSKIKYLLVLLLFCEVSISQSFDIEQTAQLIRPRLKTESRYIFNSDFSDTSGQFGYLDNTVGYTFPIKRKFSTDLKLDLSELKLKSIFKNSVRLKAYEYLGSISISNKQVQLAYDSIPGKSINSANLGLIGLHLTKKYRIFFYSVNGTFQEEYKATSLMSPRFSGLLGQYHIRGLRKSFYYGASAIYNDGIFFAMPFIGGSEPITKNFSFYYLLPAQISLQYHQNNTFAIMGTKASGFRAGIFYGSHKTSMNYASGSAFINFRHRFTKTFQVQLETGYVYYQKLKYDIKINDRNVYPVKPSFYVQVNLNMFLGKSMLEKIVDQLF